MAIINQGSIKFRVLFIISAFLYSLNAATQPLATIEIGDATLPAYTTTSTEATPFTTIDFDGEFTNPPNVFTITPQFGDEPCVIRIDNVTTTGFDAVCHEPLSEDRDSPETVFEYIAIADGGVTVPINGGGSVEFQSACANISTQQYATIRCSDCGGPLSYTPITFTPAFSVAPALIAQIQTVNNLNRDASAPAGEPEFLTTAIGDDPSSSLTTTGFNLSIERLEAGTGGALASDETICYLAAETSTTCQSLDFSSLGGPVTPVMFQALIGAQAVEGQNTSGSTTSFASGCFSSTPISFATHITRNGPQGAFLRRVSVSTDDVTLIIDEDTVRDGERTHNASEQPAIFAFSEVFTTPVTLSSAKVIHFNSYATFKWKTSAETFHLGFHLWGKTSEGWVQLNNRLIKSNGADTGEIQSYRRTIKLSNLQDTEISKFGISSVDNTGHEEFYGPFSENIAYGGDANNEPVDWTSTRHSFEQSMRDLGYVKYNNRWIRVNSTVQQRIENFNLGVNQFRFDVHVDMPGIHRINASELIALNPSWENARLNTIALTLNGQAVSRHIISDDERLDGDDLIIFNAREISSSDSPFLESYTYRLSINSSQVVNAGNFNGRNIADNNLTDIGLISEKITAKKLHSAGLTTGDPWYDTRLLSTGNPASINYIADFNYSINADQTGILDILLFGSLDFPGNNDDHHLQVSVNNQIVSDFTFDGLTGYRDQINLPSGLLTDDENAITITVVGDTGHIADVVLVDEVSISAYSALVNENRTLFDFPSDENAEGYRVSHHSENELHVYAYTNTGLLSEVQANIVTNTLSFTNLPFQENEASAVQLRYLVGPASAIPPATLSLTQGQDLHSQEADYLIISHPSFIGDELNSFVEFKTELGYNVRVIDWLEIVNTYGYGNNSPNALNHFLHQTSQLYNVDNVLLVGGHTYDYFGISDENIVNFIPSHYKSVNLFKYTATDNPYADLNGDNIPELAIGRWPVRSIEELSIIIKKTKDWHNNRESDSFQSAYLLGQKIDSQNLNFEKQLRSRVKTPLLNLDEINTVDELYLDQLPSDITDIVNHAREQLASQINSGTDIISFSGHASPTAWGFQNIINTNFIQSLKNHGNPVLLMPLACYITHFESVSTNTLAHQWLFSGDQGAAAIHGASVLGNHRENGLFAERYLNQSISSSTVGEAIKNVKQELGTNNEILHNWTLLGDPTLPIR